MRACNLSEGIRISAIRAGSIMDNLLWAFGARSKGPRAVGAHAHWTLGWQSGHWRRRRGLQAPGRDGRGRGGGLGRRGGNDRGRGCSGDRSRDRRWTGGVEGGSPGRGQFKIARAIGLARLDVVTLVPFVETIDDYPIRGCPDGTLPRTFVVGAILAAHHESPASAYHFAVIIAGHDGCDVNFRRAETRGRGAHPAGELLGCIGHVRSIGPGDGVEVVP